MIFRKYVILFFWLLAVSACDRKSTPDLSTVESSTTRIYLSDGYSNIRQMNYVVDNQLNLQVVKSIRVELFPQVLGLTDVPSLPDIDPQCAHSPEQPCGRDQLKPLRSGVYLFRYALVRNRFEDAAEAYQLISSGEQLAEVAAGSLIVDIPLKVHDLRLMGSRNHLLVELKMVDERRITKVAEHHFEPAPGFSLAEVEDHASSIKPEIFESNLDSSVASRLIFSTFDAQKLDAALNRQIADFAPWLEPKRPMAAVHIVGLRDVVPVDREIETLELAKQKRLKDNFIFTQNLWEWPVEVSQRAEVSRASLIQTLQSGVPKATTYRNLCELWGREILPDLARERLQREVTSPDLLQFVEDCLFSHHKGLTNFAIFRRLGLRFEPFFIFQDMYWVDEAHLTGVKPPGQNYNIQIADRFYVRSRTEYNFEAGLRPLSSIPLIGQFLTLAGTLAIDSSLKEDSGNELRFQTNTQINVEENTIALELTKYRHCLIVRMNPAMVDREPVRFFIDAVEGDLARDQMKRASQERGLLVCDPLAVNPIGKTEKYYYISQAPGAGLQQDPTDLRNRQVSLPLRGQRDFIAFMQAGKGQLEQPDTTSSDFAGLSSVLGAVQQAFASVSPGAAGVFINNVFY